MKIHPDWLGDCAQQHQQTELDPSLRGPRTDASCWASMSVGRWARPSPPLHRDGTSSVPASASPFIVVRAWQWDGWRGRVDIMEDGDVDALNVNQPALFDGIFRPQHHRRILYEAENREATIVQLRRQRSRQPQLTGFNAEVSPIFRPRSTPSHPLRQPSDLVNNGVVGFGPCCACQSRTGSQRCSFVDLGGDRCRAITLTR